MPTLREHIANANIDPAVKAVMRRFEDHGLNGAAASHASIQARESSASVIRKTVLHCTATPISIADDAGVAQYGGVKVYDFPEGLICTLGAVIDGALTLGTTGTIIDTYTGKVALGSATATTGATLTGTEATFLQETAITEAVAKVAVCDAISIATQLTESGARWIDGTGTPVDMFLNFAIADDASHTAGTGSFTGSISFIWMVLGDK